MAPMEHYEKILSPALQVPEHLFSDTSERSPFASQSSTSSTLLVCKSWLRVATPLLYSVVVIRSKAQAQALQKTLQNAPELGQFVKKLRVEGGFGQAMLKILQKTPNISDLVISLQLRAPDSSSGLVSGLSLINPTRLIIVDYYFWQRPNKAVEALKTALGICAAGWKNLHTIRFPYDDIIIERKPFCMALCTAPTVRILSFPMYKSSFVPVLTKIAQIPSLKAIEIRTDEPQDGPPPPPLTNPRLNELIRWVGNSMIPRASAYQSATCARTDPTFRPMSSTPQVTADRIWCRILFFAMLSLEQHPENTLPWKLPDLKLNSRRLQFLLVSKLFHRLARPYLYRYPIFLHETSVPLFAGALAAHSSLCNEVLTLDVRRPPSREILWQIRSSWAANALNPIFPHTRNLTHLIGGGDHSASISWDTFTALAKIAGGTLQQLTGFTICVQADDAPTRSAEAFRHLTAMRSLGWKCRSIPAPTPNDLPKTFPYASFRAGSKVSKVKEPPFFGVVGDLSTSALPALDSSLAPPLPQLSTACTEMPSFPL
ncbi:hypothetical protein DFH09DRAFT_1455408 [Mycena vulgaris]|nr:hypothetical protein DFH09DRAFT_1455408 [Mycena vulgaris]